MDADSAGEPDDDYNLSDDQMTDEAQTEVSEDSLSGDDWTPSGRRGGGRKRRSARDSVRGFSKSTSFKYFLS